MPPHNGRLLCGGAFDPAAHERTLTSACSCVSEGGESSERRRVLDVGYATRFVAKRRVL